MTSRQWIICVATLAGLKLLLLMLDPLPMFFLGDSQTYLGTAVNLLIPPDRSFVYGFFVRLAAVTTGSLFHLVLLQVIISTASAVILVFILVRFLATRFRTAMPLGVLCAMEPLQLLYERYVMTETLSLFIFALYFLGICYYLDNRSYLRLALLQIAGTALITVRLSFLPVVICFAVIVPLLPLLKSRPFPVKALRIAAAHLAFSLLVTFTCHSSYKHLNGFLVKGPAEYLYQSGLFLAADFAPGRREGRPCNYAFVSDFSGALGEHDGQVFALALLNLDGWRTVLQILRVEPLTVGKKVEVRSLVGVKARFLRRNRGKTEELSTGMKGMKDKGRHLMPQTGEHLGVAGTSSVPKGNETDMRLGDLDDDAVRLGSGLEVELVQGHHPAV